MNQPIDPVTRALTGELPFFLLLAAVLTFPIAWGLLWLYARSVRRSMRTHAHGFPTPSEPRPSAAQANTTGGSQASTRATLDDLSEAAPNAAADTLLARLLNGPWRAALVYTVAGGVYGILMAAAQLMAGGLEILPVRLLMLAWMFSWPVVLTVGIVAATTRRAKAAITAAYFFALAALGAFAMTRSPDSTWPQVFIPWLMYDLPPTILLLAFLSRRIRAVGPLILTFMLLALLGSDVLITIVGSEGPYLRSAIEIASRLGLGGTGTFIGLLVLGFLIFSVLGWITLIWIGRRYQAKHISDESVTVDTVWIVFALVHSIDLVFGHPLWMLAGAAALAAYKAVARIGFAWLGRVAGESQPRPTLLVLRSFSIGSDSERLFDLVGRHWRRVGSIQMIAGVDLVSRTVEPHEFLDFVSGRLSRRFIDGEESLNVRLSERDTSPDCDLRFRVNEFFCYDDTWKMVLSRLVHESDAVVMDLRGFSRQNAGCVFELHELARLVPLEHVVFVVDRRTDEALLADTLGDRRAGVFRLGSLSGKQMRQLMCAMAAAAAVRSAARQPPLASGA